MTLALAAISSLGGPDDPKVFLCSKGLAFEASGRTEARPVRPTEAELWRSHSTDLVGKARSILMSM